MMGNELLLQRLNSERVGRLREEGRRQQLLGRRGAGPSGGLRLLAARGGELLVGLGMRLQTLAGRPASAP